MYEVIAYTDGGCRGNHEENNIGAFAYYLECNWKTLSYSEGHRNTTNNRMELMAVIECLKKLKMPCKIKIHSDSAYVVNAIKQNWINGWEKNGWKRKVGLRYEELKNDDLWKELYKLLNQHEVEMVKVKGHSNCELNNYVDKLLNEEMDNMEEM